MRNDLQKIGLVKSESSLIFPEMRMISVLLCFYVICMLFSTLRSGLWCLGLGLPYPPPHVAIPASVLCTLAITLNIWFR